MSYDPLARHYAWMEYAVFGRVLQRCRFAFMPAAQTCRRALVLGEGDGRFLRRFLQTNPRVTVDCIDVSGAMLARARRRVGELGSDIAGRVRFQQADVLKCPLPPGAYDLVVTHFFFDCFQAADLHRLIRLLGICATPNALWLASDFHQPERGWAAWRARLWLRFLYAFFHWTTRQRVWRIVDPSPALRAEGFECLQRRILQFGLLQTELWGRHNKG